MPTENRYDNKLPKTISQTPAISAAVLYTAADAVGGLLTFADAANLDWGSGIIKALIIIDDDSEEVELELHLFNQTFTATTNNAAFDPTDADLENYIGFVQVLTTDYATFSTNSAAVATTTLPFNCVSGGTSLFGQLVTRGGPTYTATTDITVKLVVVKD